MLATKFRRGVLASALALAALSIGGKTIAMSVTPVVIDLQTSGRQMTELVTIENTYSRPIILEMRVERAEYSDDGVQGTGEESDDLLVFPPQTIIPPGESQAIRIQYVGDPDLAQGKHYFVTVAQLPVELPEGETVVQLLYNFQVVVGINPPEQRANISVDSAEISIEGDGQPRLVLVLSNDSAAYGYLSGGALKIVQRDAAGAEVYERTLTGEQIAQEIGFGLVGAGQTRRLATPIVLPRAEGAVEATFTPNSGG